MRIYRLLAAASRRSHLREAGHPRLPARSLHHTPLEEQDGSALHMGVDLRHVSGVLGHAHSSADTHDVAGDGRWFANAPLSLPCQHAPPTRGIKFLPVFLGALSLAACTTMPLEEPTARASTSTIDLPATQTLAMPFAAVPSSRLGTNSELARDFTELSFNLESGRTLPWFSRFEGPIKISMKGAAPAGAAQEMQSLVSRLRNEAGIDITAVNGANADPNNAIFIEFVPKRAMNAAVPNAACFVVPNVVSWEDYKDNRRGDKVDWAGIRQRTHATVFIPAEAAPQELRDCLHEETAQGLGPLNDLFRLPDTVFNDDNFHTVLTRFDMMILKATYAPELRSGMSQPEVFHALASALPRLNPAGGAVGRAADVGATPKGFVAALQRAIGAGSLGSRKAGAREAIAIAASQGWNDTRMAFAWFALGRLSVNDEPAIAVQAFTRASAIYRQIPGAGIQAAHVDMQLAAFALSTGQAQDSIALVNHALDAALKGQNAALMATLYLIRAEAYAQLGQELQAQQARLDSENWARYGFGSDAAMRQRAAEVASLARQGRG
ncbi:DUF2927 domain-containing protein [Albirhodobacter sp. R86504]|uniref:DUF2927 domain-containing protein n=1 Tax=Albirhodobacter sp. R86504 TaxID=3093848 RepID=UPI003673421C